MKPSENRPKPFPESDEYVQQLVRRCTDKAVAEAKIRHRLTIRRRVTVAAAAVLIVAGLTWAWKTLDIANSDQGLTAFTAVATDGTTENDNQLDSFLSQISDEEAQQLIAYEIEDEPEY